MPLYVARTAAVSVAASKTLTLVQIATGATRRAKIKEWGISFDGVDATKIPAQVDLLRQTTAGTASALTLVKVNPNSPAAIATAQQTFTAEPTAGDVIWSEFITPAGGFDRVQLPLGEENEMDVSGWLGLRIITLATWTTCNVLPYIRFEE